MISGRLGKFEAIIHRAGIEGRHGAVQKIAEVGVDVGVQALENGGRFHVVLMQKAGLRLAERGQKILGASAVSGVGGS